MPFDPEPDIIDAVDDAMEGRDNRYFLRRIHDKVLAAEILHRMRAPERIQDRLRELGVPHDVILAVMDAGEEYDDE